MGRNADHLAAIKGMHIIIEELCVSDSSELVLFLFVLCHFLLVSSEYLATVERLQDALARRCSLEGAILTHIVSTSGKETCVIHTSK